MNPAQALHATARRYLDASFSRWAGRYAELPNDGRDKDGYHYTKQALDTFPRYNVLNAIRVELDRIDPVALVDLESTRALVLDAGMNAQDGFTRDPIGSIDAAAMSDEREAFCSYIRGLTDSDLVAAQPLPYNRVLTVCESERLWQLLRERWKISEGYWYPLTERSLKDIEAFQDRYFHDFCSSFALDELLSSHGVTRVWELREYGPEYEQDLSVFDPHYNGAEGYWSSGDLEWIIYASHESSITIGGWLLREIKKAWPEWKQRIWTSPFS